MHRAILVLALVMAAGCTTSTSPDSSSVLPTKLPSFQGTLVGTGADTETSLAVSADGQTLLACSHGGFTQPSPMWASTDGGATFRRIPPPQTVALGVGGDCDVAIAKDGSWVLVYDSLLSVTILQTADEGKTWRISPAEDPLVGNVDRPWIQAVGDTLLVTYATIMAEQPFALFQVLSTDSGRTWSTPAVVTSVPQVDGTNCWVGHPAALEGQPIVVPLACWTMTSPVDLPPATVQLLRSDDAGVTWRLDAPLTAIGGAGVPTVSYSGDGTLWLATIDSHEVRLAASRDGGASFGGSTIVATVAGTSDWPWVDGRPDSSATVTWMEHAAPVSGGAPVWQPHAARVAWADGVPTVEDQAAIGTTWDGDMSFEFFMVRHDAAGHAFIMHPMGGADCPVVPLLGPQGTRNRECVRLVREG